jgi:hypothetical protein
LTFNTVAHPPLRGTFSIAFGTNFAHFSDGPGELSEWEIDDPNARIDRSDHRLSFKDSGSSSHC